MSSRWFLSDMTGNRLLSSCNGSSDAELNFCIGYIEGIWDGATVMTLDKQKFSISNEATSEQLKDVAVKYLKYHPEERHKHASLRVIYALRVAFPSK
jgi:hypothetical protein